MHSRVLMFDNNMSESIEVVFIILYFVTHKYYYLTTSILSVQSAHKAGRNLQEKLSSFVAGFSFQPSFSQVITEQQTKCKHARQLYTQDRHEASWDKHLQTAATIDCLSYNPRYHMVQP